MPALPAQMQPAIVGYRAYYEYRCAPTFVRSCTGSILAMPYLPVVSDPDARAACRTPGVADAGATHPAPEIERFVRSVKEPKHTATGSVTRIPGFCCVGNLGIPLHYRGLANSPPFPARTSTRIVSRPRVFALTFADSM